MALARSVVLSRCPPLVLGTRPARCDRGRRRRRPADPVRAPGAPAPGRYFRSGEIATCAVPCLALARRLAALGRHGPARRLGCRLRRLECPGGSSSGGSQPGTARAQIPLKAGEDATGQLLGQGKKGGTLTVYSSEDFQHLDTGQAYFSNDYTILYATERPLFIYPPNSPSQLEPDLATTIPTTANGGITDGGRTVTIHIHKASTTRRRSTAR